MRPGGVAVANPGAAAYPADMFRRGPGGAPVTGREGGR